MSFLAIFFPDWNSLDSVRHAHSDLEAAALIFFALLVVFDALAHLSTDQGRGKLLERVGLWFFAIAVLAEILAYPFGQRNDTLSERVIGSLGAQAKEAADNASSAETDSGKAITQAEDALDKTEAAKSEMSKALSEAKDARAGASDALNLASGARQEADSFEHDIASAKQQAADAESHLADALERAASAETQLSRLKTPRSIIRREQVVAELKTYRGTKYVFQSVFQDEESINLLRSIDELLKQAGWKRDTSLGGFPGILVYGKDQPDFAVPVGFNTGIQVFSESEVLSDWAKLSALEMPRHLKAAIALSNGLRNTVTPSDSANVDSTVSVDKGSSTTIRIAVGKKPAD